MSTDQIESIADAFVAAHGDPSQRVPAAMLAQLSAEAAMAVQGAVLRRLGETAPVAKVGITASGQGLAAPIISRTVTDHGGELALAGRNFMGLEIEIAACLGRDLTPEIVERGEEYVLAAIDHFIVGIELIGTRIDDRSQAGAFGPMADNMITAGYVCGTQKIAALFPIDGLAITASINGIERDLGLAKHPFGSALKPLMAYAAAPFDQFGGLKAGMIVTTGSLCPLIEVPELGDISLKLGAFEPVSFRLA